jgi:hypothetical protein
MGKILHASGSGYFPSCIEQVSSIESNFKSTLTNMMAVYWRVSKWKAKISGTVTDIFDAVFTFSGAEYNLNRIYGPSTEEELILCVPLPLGFRVSNVLIATSEGLDFTGQIILGLDSRVSVKKDAGDLHSMTSQLFAGFPGAGFFVDPVGSDLPNPAQIGSCSVNMAGASIVSPLFSLSELYESGDAQLTFTASEYYSYGGTYNTSTGQPL